MSPYSQTRSLRLTRVPPDQGVIGKGPYEQNAAWLSAYVGGEGDFHARVKAICGEEKDAEFVAVNIAVLLMMQGDFEFKQQGLRALKELAEAGNNHARRNLAAHYLLHPESPVQLVAALALLERVADTENAEPYLRGLALTGLGECYMNGEGVPPDPMKALQLFEEANGLGVGQAAFNIALYHDNLERDGHRGPVDLQKAIRFYRRAAELGHLQGLTHLGMLYYRGDGIPPNGQSPLELLCRAAEGGEPTALWILEDARARVKQKARH